VPPDPTLSTENIIAGRPDQGSPGVRQEGIELGRSVGSDEPDRRREIHIDQRGQPPAPPTCRRPSEIDGQVVGGEVSGWEALADSRESRARLCGMPLGGRSGVLADSAPLPGRRHVVVADRDRRCSPEGAACACRGLRTPRRRFLSHHQPEGRRRACPVALWLFTATVQRGAQHAADEHSLVASMQQRPSRNRRRHPQVHEYSGHGSQISVSRSRPPSRGLGSFRLCRSSTRAGSWVS